VLSAKESHDSKPTSLSRLWSISVILEPILLFLISDPSQTGISIGLARVFQLTVLVLLFCQICLGRTISIRDYEIKLYLPLIALLGYILVITFVNVAIDAYQFAVLQADSLEQNIFLLGALPRISIEFIVLFYNLIYFVILAPVFLKKRTDIRFFINLIMLALSMHFLLGWLDFLLVALGGIEFIPRHLSDFRHVGMRFHGIAGEPRDAAVFMLCLFYFFSLKNAFEERQHLIVSYPMVFLISASVLVTVSATAFIAIAIGFSLIIIYSHQTINLRRSVTVAVFLGFILSFSVFFVTKSERLDLYLSTYGDLFWSLLEDPLQELPAVILVSFNNVYPIIVIVNEVMDLNVLRTLFGSGLGGSGIVNSAIYDKYQNPNSQVIRLLFEYGLVGSLAYVMSIVALVKRVASSLEIDNSRIMLYSALIMLGGAFAHRSSFYLILCGLACAIASFRRRDREFI
jgi:hypothetical protein